MASGIREFIETGPFRFSLSGSGVAVRAVRRSGGAVPRLHIVRVSSGRAEYFTATGPVDSKAEVMLRARPATADAFVAAVAEHMAKPSLQAVLPMIAAAPAILGALVAGAPAVAVGTVAVVVAWLVGFLIDDSREKVALLYDLDDAAQTRFAEVLTAFGAARSCSRIWAITAEHAHGDWKRNAGTTHHSARSAAALSVGAPNAVRTNLDAPIIQLGKQSIYIFPDRVLVVAGRKAAAVALSDLRVSVAAVRFVEDGATPADASVVGLTWRYVNKAGGPDRRFKNNQELSICSYDELTIGGGAVAGGVLQFSRAGATRGLAAAIKAMAQRPAIGHVAPGKFPAMTSKPSPAQPVVPAAPMAPTNLASHQVGERLREMERRLFDNARSLQATAQNVSLEPSRPIPAATSPVLALSTPPEPVFSKKVVSRSDVASIRWVPQGERVTIADIPVEAGLFYVRRWVGAAGADDEFAIDVTLEVSPHPVDPQNHDVSFWRPSYKTLTPRQRRIYCDWLARGRNGPAVGPGYVLLFLRGLEKRLFEPEGGSDAGLIADAIRRLGDADRNLLCFDPVTRLLEAARIVCDGAAVRPALSPHLRLNYEFRLTSRLYLGRVLASGAALDADDALLWALSAPDSYLRTPAVRCFDGLVAVWRSRFAALHPEGLRVRAPKTRLKPVYQPFLNDRPAIDLSPWVGDDALPDIARVTAPLTRLQELVQTSTEALDSYSRYVGRNPDAAEKSEAIFLLPPEALPGIGGRTFERIKDNVENLFDGAIARTTGRRLLSVLELSAPGEKLTAAVAAQVATALDRLHIGHEPDRRYGPATQSMDGDVVLFRAENGAPVDSGRPEYAAAQTMIEIALLSAHADREASDAEFATIRADIRKTGLTTIERARLLAFAVAFSRDAPRRDAVLKRLSRLPEAERRKAARAALSAALADGHVLADEVRFLEKLYKSLGLREEELYFALHAGAAVIDGPIIVAPERPSTGVAIPGAPQPSSGEIGIDVSRLERIRAETSAVSALLAGIFADDPEPVPPVAIAATAASAFKGLDPSHAALLSTILASPSMSRADYERRARDLQLLPDGAIETINEWGFEAFDEAVLEDDDEVVVSGGLRLKLEQLETAA